MALRRPQHRADATITFVAPQDPAWDFSRVDQETEEIRAHNERERALVAAAEKKNADEEEAAAKEGREPVFVDVPTPAIIDAVNHPVARYFAGETRYDIDAREMWRGEHRAASDYLNQGATRFILRRLAWRDWHAVQSLRATDPYNATILACELGVERVEGADWMEIDPTRARRSYKEMEALASTDLGPELHCYLGNAVIKASEPLTDAEKKV